MSEIALVVEGLWQSYNGALALSGVDISVDSGARVAVIGPNGAGKTSLLRVIAGLTPADRGNVVLFGENITKVPAWRRSRMGISLCPEQRRVFSGMSVAENLNLGGHRLKRLDVKRRRDVLVELFPALKRRIHQDAANLSGGEQQMLAIARALMAEPRLLLLDEPTLGLSPLVAREILSSLGSVASETSVVLVEQNAEAALRATQYGYVLLNGRVQNEGPSKELLSVGWELGSYQKQA